MASTEERSRTPWWTLSALALLALVDSIWLYVLQKDLHTFAAVCHVAPGFDCAPALASRYSRIFDIPLSSYAVASYLFLAALALQGIHRDDVRDRNAFILTGLLTLATAFCARLAWISYAKLSAYCPYCLVLHILTPLMLCAALWCLFHRRTPLRNIFRSEWDSIRGNPVVAGGLVFAIVAVAAGLPLYQQYARQRMLDSAPIYRQVLEGTYPRLDELRDLVKDYPALGPPDARVAIIEFADFLCPVCRESHDMMSDLVKEYGLRYTFIAHPRSRECNPDAEASRPGSCLGAHAVEYARGTDRYWQVHEALFRDASLLEEKGLPRLLEVTGAPNLEAITQDSAVAMRVFQDLAVARYAGVAHTPSLFINGMGVQGMPDEWFLREVIEREMKRP
jgi:uncharacterized membrane protein